MKFVKKPVVIEAIQYTGYYSEVERFCGKDNLEIISGELYIKTLEGNMKVSKDDWIIKGVKGEFYPCKPDIFEATYYTAEFKACDKCQLWRIGWQIYPKTLQELSELAGNLAQVFHEKWMEAVKNHEAPPEDISPGESFLHIKKLIDDVISDSQNKK